MATCIKENKGDLGTCTVNGIRCEECFIMGKAISHKCQSCDLMLCVDCVDKHTNQTIKENDVHMHVVINVKNMAEDVRQQAKLKLKEFGDVKKEYEAHFATLMQRIDSSDAEANVVLEVINQREEALKNHFNELRNQVQLAKEQYCKDVRGSLHNTQKVIVGIAKKEKYMGNLMNESSSKNLIENAALLQDLKIANEEVPPVPRPFSMKLSGQETDLTKDFYLENQNSIGSTKDEDIKEYWAKDVEKDYKYDIGFEIPDSCYIISCHIHGNEIYQLMSSHGRGKINVYTFDLEHKREIILNFGTSRVVSMSAFVITDTGYIITSSTEGIIIHDIQGQDLQRIAEGQYQGLGIHEQNIYAYSKYSKKIDIIKKTTSFWKVADSVNLKVLQDYVRDGGIEVRMNSLSLIHSFLMNKNQFYILSGANAYVFNLMGELVRKFNCKTTEFCRNPPLPILCQVDEKGNVLFIDRNRSKLVLSNTSGEMFDISLRGFEPNEIDYAVMDEAKNNVFICCSYVEHLNRRNKINVFSVFKPQTPELPDLFV